MQLPFRFVALPEKKFGIKAAEDFSRRFEAAYGPGAINRFKELIEDPDNTLADVGRHFGFSKQYTHKVFTKIYGYPYRMLFDKKRQIRKSRDKEKNQIKVSNEIKEVINRIESLGLSVDLKKKERATMLSVNGQALLVRTAKRPFRMGTRDHYRINNLHFLGGDVDYLICACKGKDKNTFFILPQEKIKRPNITLIPSAGLAESKYAQFKEAWYILKNNKNEKSSPR